MPLIRQTRPPLDFRPFAKSKEFLDRKGSVPTATVKKWPKEGIRAPQRLFPKMRNSTSSYVDETDLLHSWRPYPTIFVKAAFFVFTRKLRNVTFLVHNNMSNETWD